MTRTREEALDFVIQQAKEGKIGPKLFDGDDLVCRYIYPSGNHCAVGCLLTDDLLEKIKNEGVNGENFNEVSRIFGRDKLEAMTGLTQHELAFLQEEHDIAFLQGGNPPEERLKQAIKNVIEAAESLRDGYRPHRPNV